MYWRLVQPSWRIQGKVQQRMTPALLRHLRLKFFYNAGAIAMVIRADAHSLQHRQPHITQRSIFLQDKVLAEFQVGSTTSENCWAVGEVMD